MKTVQTREKKTAVNAYQAFIKQIKPVQNALKKIGSAKQPQVVLHGVRLQITSGTLVVLWTLRESARVGFYRAGNYEAYIPLPPGVNIPGIIIMKHERVLAFIESLTANVKAAVKELRQ